MKKHIRIKICCISSFEEARMAIDVGADALGFVGRMPSGPGVIDEELIAAIAKNIPPPVATFLLTCEQSSENIINQVKKAGTNTVQIVDELTEGGYQNIREKLPNIKLVQVIHVTGNHSVEEALKVQDDVDAILLDSGNPRAAVKILGGTGNVHNWEISRAICQQISKPVFLAGGLQAGNVIEAIQTVKPFGVDVCSSLRTNGKLDIQKLEAFVNAVHEME